MISVKDFQRDAKISVEAGTLTSLSDMWAHGFSMRRPRAPRTGVDAVPYTPSSSPSDLLQVPEKLAPSLSLHNQSQSSAVSVSRCDAGAFSSVSLGRRYSRCVWGSRSWQMLCFFLGFAKAAVVSDRRVGMFLAGGRQLDGEQPPGAGK